MAKAGARRTDGRIGRCAPATASVALFVAIVLAACESQPRVVISTREGKEIPVRVEVADTPSKRELGLQFRRELGDNHGMIFLFPAEREQSFWMKNTPIPLDIIFIGAGRRIVGIVARTVPFSTESLSVSVPSQFVLEVNGGFAERHGLNVGDPVRFEGISPENVRE